jgi:hypothetical protein
MVRNSSPLGPLGRITTAGESVVRAGEDSIKKIAEPDCLGSEGAGKEPKELP